jgi:DnaJ-class molecular chaperone
MATVPQTVPCPFCQGVGRERKGDECDACGGAGQIPVDMNAPPLAA